MKTARLTAIIQWGLLVLVAIMPVHAFLSVYAGHLFGHQAIWQSWKEVLLILLTLAAGLLLIHEPQRLQRLRSPWVYALFAFGVIALLVTVAHKPSLTSIAYGLKTDFEFLLAALLATLVSNKLFVQRIITTITISSGVVIAFGLFQIYLLPANWLAQFGYGPDTIEPFLGLDPAVTAVRIIATLGGPNQLGSFLLLPLLLVLWQAMKAPRWWQPIYLLAGGIVLWHTYARAAYLGLIVGIGILILLRVARRWRLPLLLAGTLLLAIGLNLITTLSGSNRALQYYVFHQSIQETGYAASTDQHLQAYQHGLVEAQRHPLGLGLGAAGPASFHSTTPVITENYYLQLALETGLAGLATFIALEILVGIELWRRNRQSLLASASVATLAGVSVVNLFLHGWTDSSTALIAWTAIGAALGETQA